MDSFDLSLVEDLEKQLAIAVERIENLEVVLAQTLERLAWVELGNFQSPF